MKVYRGYDKKYGPITHPDWIYVTSDLEQAKWYASRNNSIKNGAVIEYEMSDNLDLLSINDVNKIMSKEGEEYTIDDLLWYQEGLADYLYEYGQGIEFEDPKFKNHTIYIIFNERYLKNGKIMKNNLNEAYIKAEKGNIYYTKNSDMFLSIIKNTFISKNIPVRVYYDTIKQMYVFGNAFDYIHADLATGMKYYSKVYGVDEMRANISYLKQNCALFQVLPDDDLKKYDMGDGYTHGWILPLDNMFFACRNNEYKKVRDEVPLFKDKVGFWQGTEYYEHQKSQQVVNESTEPKFNKNFWKWFKGSKIVDEKGKPLICYHGTTKKFKFFDKTKIGKRDKGWYGKGFYFTPDYDTAYSYYTKTYSGNYSKNRTVMPCYLSIKNPYIVDDWMVIQDKYGFKVEPEYLKNFDYSKYDGIIVYYSDWRSRKKIYEIIAFEPNQIKSVDNNGEWSDSNDIYESLTESINEQLNEGIIEDLDYPDKNAGYYTYTDSDLLNILENKYKDLDTRIVYEFNKKVYLIGNSYSIIHNTLLEFAILSTNIFDSIPEISKGKESGEITQLIDDAINNNHLKLSTFKIFRNNYNYNDNDFIKYLKTHPDNNSDGYNDGYVCKINNILWAICRNDELDKTSQVPLLKNKKWINLDNKSLTESIEDNFNSKNNCKVVLKDGKIIYGRFIDKWEDNSGKGIFIKSNSANKIKEDNIKELYMYYDCEVITKNGKTIYGNFAGDFGDHKLHLDDAFNRKGWAIKDEVIDKVNYKKVLKKELNEGILGAIAGGLIGKKYKHPYIGAYIGHKIQDKFFNSKNKKDNKENKIDYKKIIYNEIFNDLKNKKIGIDTAIDMLIDNKIAKDYDDANNIVDFWCYEYGLDKSLNEDVEDKILYIIRGVPGSGKSTLAHKLTDNVVEADQYFYDDKGNYNWSADKLNQAHNWCFYTVKKYMEEGRNKIAVANTFVKKRDYKRYVELAEQFGYKVDIRVCNGNFKNIHGVPDETVEKMRAKFQLDESVLNDKVFYTRQLSRMLNICLNIGNARFIYIPKANLYVMGDAHNNTHISLFISALNEGKFDIGENDVDEYFDEYINSAEDTGAIITKKYANDENIWLKCPDTTNVINDYGKFYLCNGLCIEESLAKLTNTEPRFIKEKSYLKESIKSVNKNFADTKLITTPYELNNYLKNNRESRVVYDIKNNWYLVGNAETSIHINLINDAFVDGYYQPFEYNGKMINPDNELDAKGGKLIYELNPVNFILFRTSSDQLNGEDYYYDGYKYCYIYDDYYVFLRDNNFEKTSLYQMVLGFPKDIEFIGDIDEDEGLNESIAFVSKKDLSDIILKNPTRKELRDNHLVQCRCIEDSEGNWYFADMENMLHAYIVYELKDEASFPLFDGNDCYGIAYYDAESNEFWYNLNDYMYRKECIEQYNNSKYLRTTFPNAKIIPNPWNNQMYDELYDDEEQLDESIAFVSKKDLSDIILKNPTRKELKENGLEFCRYMFEDDNTYYFVDAKEYSHLDISQLFLDIFKNYNLHTDGGYYSVKENCFYIRNDFGCEKNKERLDNTKLLHKLFGNFKSVIYNGDYPKEWDAEQLDESAENDKTLRDYAVKLANICLDALVKTKYETRISKEQVQINVDKAFKKAVPMLKNSPYEYFFLLVSKKDEPNPSFGKTVDKKYGLITFPVFSSDPFDLSLSLLFKHKSTLNKLYSIYSGDELKLKMHEYATKYLKNEIKKRLEDKKNIYLDLLIHECTHLLDDVRRTKTYKSKEQELKNDKGIEDYYNSPEEQNAFYQETVSIFDEWANQSVGYKTFDIFWDDFIRQYKGEYNMLNDKNKRKLKKRAYTYWYVYMKD